MKPTVLNNRITTRQHVLNITIKKNLRDFFVTKRTLLFYKRAHNFNHGLLILSYLLNHRVGASDFYYALQISLITNVLIAF